MKVRRSPRKLVSPDKEDRPLHQQQLATPRLKLGSLPPSSPSAKAAAATPPAVLLRKSPRKQLSTSLPPLSRPAGFSKLMITGNAILPADGSTTPNLPSAGGGGGTAPSSNNSTPTGLIRTPSFTMLEPASYAAASQLSALTTDTCQGGGRTPLLRASVTSTCSSAALPAVTPAAAAAAAAASVLPPSSSKQQLSRGGSSSNVTSSSRAHTPCGCAGRPRVCGACLELQHMHAARAGTPGFRPPEVLLKHAGQTTAIDLWAVGVILLCILSRSYPFFRAPDDLTALAELTVLFGSRAVKETAKRYGRRLLTSQESEPKNLGFLCK
jgi:hypothetical protein